MAKKISNTELLELYLPTTVLPEVPVLGWQRFGTGTPGGVRPGDLQHYEICFVDKGSVEWWIDDRLIESEPRSLFINKPGEWRGGISGLIQPCEMYFVQFSLPPQGTLPGLSGESLQSIIEDFQHIHHRSFTASPTIKSYFKTLLTEQRQPGEYAIVYARAAFHQILITTLRDHARKTAFRYSDGVARVVQWLQDNLEDTTRVSTLAKIADMSTSQFYKRFTAEVGLTPADYHLRLRIVVAKQLLRNTQDRITDIALQLGLSSSQYFATVFKRVVGMTPGEYRQVRQMVPTADERMTD